MKQTNYIKNKNNKNNNNNKNKTKKLKIKGQLFSNNNPDTTVKNTGFKNKEIALKTIKDMHDRDITYQFQVINTMYQRNLQVQKKTKNEDKIKNLKQAEKILKEWLDNYKNKNRKNEMFHYIPLDVVNNFETLAKYYNISKKARGLEKPTKSDKGFLTIYREVKGDIKKLRNYPIKKTIPEGQTWDKHRNNYCKRRKTMINNQKKMYVQEGTLKGLPTKLHTNMIMWACSPDYKKIIKLSKKLKNFKTK